MEDLNNKEILLHKKVFLTKVNDDEIELFSIGDISIQSYDNEDAVLVTDKRLYHANKNKEDRKAFISTIDVIDIVKVEYGVPKRVMSLGEQIIFWLIILLFFPLSLLYLLYIYSKRKNIIATIEYTKGTIQITLSHKDYNVFVSLRDAIFSAKDKVKKNNNLQLPFKPKKDN